MGSCSALSSVIVQSQYGCTEVVLVSKRTEVLLTNYFYCVLARWTEHSLDTDIATMERLALMRLIPLFLFGLLFVGGGGGSY
jgi:hypothetical protein